MLPYLLKTNNNPDGVEPEVFEKMGEQIKDDRADFLANFGKQFFGVGLVSHPVSQSYLQWNQTLALLGSPKATLDCAKSFSETDFREDIKAVTVPALIIHGDSDKTVPIQASSAQTAKVLVNATYKIYEGAPHGLYYTDRNRLNEDLLSFCRQ